MGKTYKDCRDKSRFLGNRNFRFMTDYKKEKVEIYPTIRCGNTGKVGWKSWDNAQKKVKEIMEQDSSAFLRVYYCKFCKHYHCSSQPLKTLLPNQYKT